MRQYVQRHDGFHPSPAALLLSVTLLAHCACFVGGQFVANSELFEQQVGEVNAELQNYLQNLRGLEDSYFPNKYDIPTDYYIFRPPDRRTEFTQNVIFDPCRGHEYHCCNDTFGSPEYERVLAATGMISLRTITLQRRPPLQRSIVQTES
ncbi:MAG: hypothetical protein EOO65_01650 [Methanosarcinales archaeon]|nr:MAG: hypothetical protein EOO65_01650 [Methanosarcinales archaeon]